jgi:hypothetical protein
MVTQFVTHIWRDLSTPSEFSVVSAGESDAEAACWVHGLTASVSAQPDSHRGLVSAAATDSMTFAAARRGPPRLAPRAAPALNGRFADQNRLESFGLGCRRALASTAAPKGG